MRGRATGVLVLLILLLGVPALAVDDVEMQATKARSLQRKQQHDRALTLWRDLIAKHGKHPVVADGEVDLDRPRYRVRYRVRDRGVTGGRGVSGDAGGGRRSGEEREVDEPRGGCGGHTPEPARPTSRQKQRRKPRPTPSDVSP